MHSYPHYKRAIVPRAELWAALKWLVSFHFEAEKLYLTRGVCIHYIEVISKVFWVIEA